MLGESGRSKSSRSIMFAPHVYMRVGCMRTALKYTHPCLAMLHDVTLVVCVEIAAASSVPAQ